MAGTVDIPKRELLQWLAELHEIQADAARLVGGVHEYGPVWALAELDRLEARQRAHHERAQTWLEECS